MCLSLHGIAAEWPLLAIAQKPLQVHEFHLPTTPCLLRQLFVKAALREKDDGDRARVHTALREGREFVVQDVGKCLTPHLLVLPPALTDHRDLGTASADDVDLLGQSNLGPAQVVPRHPPP